MWASNFIAGGLLLFLGIMIRVFNLSGLIAGYNTASPEKKEKVNERALTRFVGMMLVAGGIVLLIGGLFICLNIAVIIIMPASWVLFVVIIFGGLLYVNLSPRFKKND